MFMAPTSFPSPIGPCSAWSIGGPFRPLESFAILRPAGVDAAIASAVGDPIVTRAWRGRPWDAVVNQLEQLRTEINGAGCELASGRGGRPARPAAPGAAP